jgi:hypothetical protein
MILGSRKRKVRIVPFEITAIKKSIVHFSPAKNAYRLKANIIEMEFNPQQLNVG